MHTPHRLHLAPPEQESGTLPILEGAMLWSMRAWAIGVARGIEVEEDLRSLFDILGAPDLAVTQDIFMQALHQGAMRVLEVNCVCYPEISGDEQNLLDVLTLHQEGHAADACCVLERMLMPEHAMRANLAAGRMVASLNDAGRSFADRLGALSRHAFSARMGEQSPPSCAGGRQLH